MKATSTDTHAEPPKSKRSTWNFLSNHTYVLMYLIENTDTRLRSIARAVGITERSAFNIVVDLENVGILQKTRNGHRNHYELNIDKSHESSSDPGALGTLLRIVSLFQNEIMDRK